MLERPHGSLHQEIAQVEQQVDSIEANTVAMIASLPLGGLTSQPPSAGEKVSCWPAPENAENINTNCCDLGLSDAQENNLVAFLKTRTDEAQP